MTNATMVWTLLCVAVDIDVREITHISGEQNESCDQLSRRGHHPIMSVEEHANNLGITGAVITEAQSDPAIMTMLRLGDPQISIQSNGEFCESDCGVMLATCWLRKRKGKTMEWNWSRKSCLLTTIK